MEWKKVQPLKNNLKLVGEFLRARGKTPDMEITSLPSLNKKIWGIGRKKLMIIASRPSHGKSSLAMQIAWDISKLHKVLIMSLEQTIEETIERMFCNTMKVDNLELLKGGFMLYQDKWEIFCKLAQERSIIVTESIGKTWQEIDELLSNIEEYPDLIIMDYIQCISNGSFKKLETIDQYILHLRNLAIQNNFAVILCSQINRQNVGTEGAKPTLSGMKGSGYLEELGDKILLLHWEAQQNYSADLDKFKIIIAKNKGGRTGDLDCTFEPQYYKFTDELSSKEQLTIDDMSVMSPIIKLFDGEISKVHERKDIDG